MWFGRGLSDEHMERDGRRNERELVLWFGRGVSGEETRGRKSQRIKRHSSINL
jgi:hypothetical protein